MNNIYIGKLNLSSITAENLLKTCYKLQPIMGVTELSSEHFLPVPLSIKLLCQYLLHAHWL